MDTNNFLKNLIVQFSTDNLVQFFRSKARTFTQKDSEVSTDKADFTDGLQLGEFKTDISELAIYCFKVQKPLSERSGKKAQYELAKRILKQEQRYSAGIFVFYDDKGDFRFSLVYDILSTEGKRTWSNFRRFTYFVSKEQTNKTFIRQIGDADFSTLEKIKEAFSVEPISKQFYSEIQNWYFWAQDKIKFPDNYKYSNDPAKDKEIRNATNLIRLITRIIFIWFLKEKDLVPRDLFSKEKLAKIVRDFLNGKNASNFYNAILQNLFFATLNQKMNERKFADEAGFPANRKEYGVKNLYRYADKFLISKDEVLKLFGDIPFLNGGLFDCLDKEDETGKVIYVDGFSRNPAKQAIIPDYLFFQQVEEKVDLSQYGLGRNKPVRGLIEILNSYNFTIDENTPVDQEIALDPEMLGKIFENLLASYNPETATTARKATGSYYTPREIVDYMVESSLLEYLKGKLPEIDEVKIKILFTYSDEIPEFTEEEKKKIIEAIDNLKILDPACGSGAFPMGILHKIVFALQKLDPENKYWHNLQYQKALKETEEIFKQDDKNEREERLKEINEAFDESINYPDYARKLYLIENCIYGVDIQPIAVQISKLRFFISLVVDQKVERSKENFGIRALPNLETKFVSANTLIGLDKPQHLFYTDEVRKLEEEIKSLRHKYFTAKTRKEKLDYQNKDKELRKLLAKELEKIGFSSDSSEKIARFDLYDQNASADFFDPEWMFGVKDGFDIVIGNPPYITYKGKQKVKVCEQYIKQLLSLYPNSAEYKINSFALFIEKGVHLVNKMGILSYIIPSTILQNEYLKKIRKYLLSKYHIQRIVYFQNKVFESITDSIILFLRNESNLNQKTEFIIIEDVVFLPDDKKQYFLQSEWNKSDEGIINIKINTIEDEILSDIEAGSEILDLFLDAKIGIKRAKAPVVTKPEKGYKKFLQGRDIKKYRINFDRKYILFRKSLFHTSVDEQIFLQSEKILIRKTGNILLAAYDNEQYYTDQSVYNLYPKRDIILNLKYILALLNSTLMNFYFKKKIITNPDVYPYIKGIHLKKLPLKNIEPIMQKPFIDLVDKILSITKDDDYLENPDKQAKVKEYERQIDQMVYKLYGLTEEEIRIVEGK